MEAVCTAKALQLVLGAPSPKVPWDLKRMVSADFFPVAMCLQSASNVKADIKLLENKEQPMELEDIVKKLSLFETVTSAGKMEVLAKDPLFEQVCQDFKNFRIAFVNGVKLGLATFDATHLSILRNFAEKYSEVSSAAEKWQMAPVAFHFGDKYDETKEAIDQVIAAKGNMALPMSSLASLCSHGSMCKDLKAVIQDCVNMHKEGVSLTTKADMLGASMLVAALLLNGKSNSADAKATVEVMQKTFSMSRDKLPLKMQKLLTDLLKSDGGKDPDTEAVGEKKPKRKKEKETDKKQKEKSEKPAKKAKVEKGKDGQKASRKKKQEKAEKPNLEQSGESSSE
eukprot:Skav218193  [mRNA]  locus=scaffold6534:4354:5373:+ [translate_table: standard]